MARVGRTAFTLVEILVVVILLGILAAIVVPQFSNATQSARASMLGDDLRVMRMQVIVFKAQHNSISPGYPGGDVSQTPTEGAFVAHFTQASKANCETAAPGTSGYPFGPYMRQMPENPINGKRTVLVLSDSATFPDASTDGYGWVYQPSTLLFKSDATGSDEDGRSYFDY
jgi:prepilin-type N-terminal cleavage/methylation domain-containing protein